MHPSAGRDGFCGLQRLDIDGRAYVRYSRHLRINPSDAEANRGAYLAAGFVAERVLSMHEAASCIDAVAQICGHLKSLVGPDNRVPTDFELTKYAFGAQRLEDVIDHGCSPLLQLDVLLQAMHSAGPTSFRPGKPIFLEPAPDVGAGDAVETDRRLFYFDGGAAGAQLELERERAGLKRLTERLVVAASYCDQVQDEWLSYQALIQEHLPSVATRGSELRILIDEVERLTGSLDRIGAATGGVPAVDNGARAASGARRYVGAVPARRRGAGAPAQPAGRRPRSRSPLRAIPRPSFRVAVGLGAAVVVAAAVTIVLQLFVLGSQPSSVRAVEEVTDTGPVDEAADTGEGAGTSVATPAQDARSDVVRERAALGQRTPE